MCNYLIPPSGTGFAAVSAASRAIALTDNRREAT